MLHINVYARFMLAICLLRAVGSISNARSHDPHESISRRPPTCRQFCAYRRIRHWVLPRVHPFGSTTARLDCSSRLLWAPYETTVQVISICFTCSFGYSSTCDVSLDHISLFLH